MCIAGATDIFPHLKGEQNWEHFWSHPGWQRVGGSLVKKKKKIRVAGERFFSRALIPSLEYLTLEINTCYRKPKWYQYSTVHKLFWRAWPKCPQVSIVLVKFYPSINSQHRSYNNPRNFLNTPKSNSRHPSSGSRTTSGLQNRRCVFLLPFVRSILMFCGYMSLIEGVVLRPARPCFFGPSLASRLSVFSWMWMKENLTPLVTTHWSDESGWGGPSPQPVTTKKE